MKRITMLGAALMFGAVTAMGGAHGTHAVTLQSNDTCHFSHGSSFKVYNDTQEDQIEQAGGTCSGPIA